MNFPRSTGLTELAVAVGDVVDTAGNLPVLLDDPRKVWFVERGALDVFLVEYVAGEPASQWRHVLRAEPGHLVFGVGDVGEPLVAVGKGVLGSRLRCLCLTDLENGVDGDELAAQVEAWVSEFAAMVARQVEPRPAAGVLLVAGEAMDCEAGDVLSARPGTVVWSSAVGQAYLGTEEPLPVGEGLIPLTSDAWLTLAESTTATGFSTCDLNEEGRLLPALAEFHRLAMGAERLNRMLLLADQSNEQATRAARRHSDEVQARESLFGVLGKAGQVPVENDSLLLAALQIVGAHEGVTFRSPRLHRAPDGDWSMRQILDASGSPFPEGETVGGRWLVARRQWGHAGVRAGRWWSGCADSWTNR